MSSKVKAILANGEVIDDSIEANRGTELSDVAQPNAPQPELPDNVQFPEKKAKAVLGE